MFKTWTKFEKVWLVTFLLLIVATTVVFSLNGTDYKSMKSILLNWVISPLSAITGILCVVLVAKGNIWNYAWGLVNCISYGYLAYQSGYYGDMVLNLFYFLPFQFIGYFWWNKHLKPFSKTNVIMRRLSFKQAIIYTLAGFVATVGIGLVLTQVDHWFVNVMKRNVSIYTYINKTLHIPYLGEIFDASTEILQIVAQLLMTFAFAEQWICWILTNIITIIMWVVVIVADKSTIAWALPTVIMWVAYLVNSVYGYVNWLRGAKEVAA